MYYIIKEFQFQLESFYLHFEIKKKLTIYHSQKEKRKTGQFLIISFNHGNSKI